MPPETSPTTSSERARRPRRRRALVAAACLLLAAGVLAVAWLTRDPLPRMRARHGPIAAVLAQRAPRAEDGYRLEELRITSRSGLAVELALKRPLAAPTAGAARKDDDLAREDGVRRPLLVLLGGHESGRDALRLIGDTRGTAIVALSYPYAGNHKAKGFELLRSLPAIRGALLDTPPAIGLALDWLLAQPWVDRLQVELVGVSLGAPFVCIAGALDERVTRVWSVHGAGDPYALLEHALARKIGFTPLRVAAASMVNVLASGSQIAPERWVAGISPRPFVMINASEDERLPRAAVERLYDAAREPKEIHWLPGRHVGPKRKEIVAELVGRVLDRVTVGR